MANKQYEDVLSVTRLMKKCLHNAQKQAIKVIVSMHKHLYILTYVPPFLKTIQLYTLQPADGSHFNIN